MLLTKRLHSCRNIKQEMNLIVIKNKLYKEYDKWRKY